MQAFLMNPDTVMFFQLLLAIVLGGILGIQRSLSHKGAGMRTYALVTMSSCLFILISQIIQNRIIGLIDFSPMQVPAAIITGIGFLGAGLIIFKDEKLNGITTAAGLWVSCGIGIAVGFGIYLLPILATALTFIVFSLFWRIENAITRKSSEQISEDII